MNENMNDDHNESNSKQQIDNSTGDFVVMKLSSNCDEQMQNLWRLLKIQTDLNRPRF